MDLDMKNNSSNEELCEKDDYSFAKIENLDKKLCDIYSGSTNKDTLREFFINGYRDLGIRTDGTEFDTKSDKQLREIAEELDWLLSK